MQYRGRTDKVQVFHFSCTETRLSKGRITVSPARSPCLLDTLSEVGADEDVLDGGEGHEEVLPVDATAVLPHPVRLEQADGVGLARGVQPLLRVVEEANVVALKRK